jgi:hypothetical protein
MIEIEEEVKGETVRGRGIGKTTWLWKESERR